MSKLSILLGNFSLADRKWLSRIFCGVIFLMVFLNIFTPLRLNNDAVRYLKIVEYLNGNTQNNDAAADFLPHGYPWLLHYLNLLSSLDPLILTTINIISVGVSTYLITIIFKVEHKLIFIALVFLSFINIKHFTLPVSDHVFTLLFTTSIYFWSHSFNKNIYYIIPALLVTLLSIYVRTAGISILCGVLFYFLYRYRIIFKRSKWLTLLGIAALSALFYFAVFTEDLKIDYLRQLNLGNLTYAPWTLIKRFALHLQEIGELILNLPASKVSGTLQFPDANAIKYFFILTGLIFLLFLFRASLKIKDTFIFWACFSYLLMILFWPYYDTRFLIPVIPFILYVLHTYMLKSARKGLQFLKTYLVISYTVLGFVALTYSVLLSLNEQFFLDHYGFDPQLIKTYEIHFRDKQGNSVHDHTYQLKNDAVLFILQKYDR